MKKIICILCLTFIFTMSTYAEDCQPRIVIQKEYRDVYCGANAPASMTYTETSPVSGINWRGTIYRGAAEPTYGKGCYSYSGTLFAQS